jgi:hypothetical protein
MFRKSFLPVTVGLIHASRWTDREETDQQRHTTKLARVFYEGANTFERVIPDTRYSGLEYDISCLDFRHERGPRLKLF